MGRTHSSHITHPHTASEKREGAGSDKEVRGVAKRKMLGNIKFVGEWACVECVMCVMCASV